MRLERLVFVSHTGQNDDSRKFAADLAGDIEEICKWRCAGCFYDETSIDPGDPWREVIIRKARNCKIFVCVLCEEYFHRKWCMKELSIALGDPQRVVLPVYLQNGVMEFDDDFKKIMRVVHLSQGSPPDDIVEWIDLLDRIDSKEALFFNHTVKRKQYLLRKSVVKAVFRKLLPLHLLVWALLMGAAIALLTWMVKSKVFQNLNVTASLSSSTPTPIVPSLRPTAPTPTQASVRPTAPTQASLRPTAPPRTTSEPSSKPTAPRDVSAIIQVIVDSLLYVSCFPSSNINIEYPLEFYVTPEEKALKWLIEDDPARLNAREGYGNIRILQRYALASQAFQTGGLVSGNWLTDDFECDWDGVYCDHETGGVRGVDLKERNLRGQITNYFVLIEDLRYLDLSKNSLTGTIPCSLGLIAGLAHLDLSFNRLGGSIPLQLGFANRMERFDTSVNDIRGTLPDFLGQWNQLRTFDVSDTFLYGTIPDSYGAWSSVERVNIELTDLTGNASFCTKPAADDLISALADCSVICPCCKVCCSATNFTLEIHFQECESVYHS